MNFETLLVDASPPTFSITLHRENARNSINDKLLDELNLALDASERLEDCPLVILQGRNGVFCTGMDFNEAVSRTDDITTAVSRRYLEAIKRLSLIPKIIVSKVEGQVMAGGIGLVAASDLVVATPKSQFSLSEALWGLLPACVIPFLIRRVGFQTAYKMTLTTLPIDGEEAARWGLVDLITDTPDASIRRLLLRLVRLDGRTVGQMKRYFRKMWLINESMEDMAVEEITELLADDQVRANIHNFVTHGQFPWDRRTT